MRSKPWICLQENKNEKKAPFLTLNGLIPGKVKKLNKIFIFTLLCDASKGFMKTLKVFIKPFEAPQRSVEIKISLNFYFNTAFRNDQVFKG